VESTPETRKKAKGGIIEETKQTLNNLEKILTAAGTTKDKVLKVNIYIADVCFWPQVNKIYSDFFGNHKPTRIIVAVNNLHYDCLIEIEAIAIVED
jgi:2-iminobutanoate/2-iminopropanoate deaminase